ncbi:MAG: sensor histidine kinase [Eubacterium sp.]|nr:sensor histidine kinase [Eubacterium sp.]
MIETILYYLQYGTVLAFGIILSCAFCGLSFSKKNITFVIGTFILCGALQLLFLHTSGETGVWIHYPLITHLPLFLLLCIVYRKRILTVIAAIATAYMCCQLSKWVGLLTVSLGGSVCTEQMVHILTLLLSGYIILRYAATYIAELYHKETRSIIIFGIVPIVYYVFDYAVYIYSDFWATNGRFAVEFLPFFLCIIFLVFCIIYYREQELAMDAKRREQMVQITIEQQQKEMDAIRHSEKAVRLLRHDMRFLLNQISLSMENQDLETANRLIAGYLSEIEDTAIQRYCDNDTLNYVFTLYASKCKEQNIPFEIKVAMAGCKVDELLFSSILSNALDNALNAQSLVPYHRRHISVWLKEADGKLLLSVKNACGHKPTFVDGVPISRRANHGYGTQSIRYLTERLGGNYQFSIDETNFNLKIVI